MKPILPKLVEPTLQGLIRAFAPARIILFESYAKGSAHTNSDVDLLVIANLSGNMMSHKKRAFQLSSDCFPRVDVVFATPEEVANASLAKSPFLLSILDKGITIYEMNTGVSNSNGLGRL